MPLKWHKSQFIQGSGHRWAGDGNLESDRTTWVIYSKHGPDYGSPISRTNPAGYLLWVWHGPAEHAAGGMPADYRDMKRAHYLGWHKTLRDAKEAAQFLDDTGEYR
jgi:hypothetical protein